MPKCTVVREDSDRVALAYYQSLTIPIKGRPSKLPDEFCPEVSQLCQKMYANGNLTAEDKEWCEKNGISYNKE